MIHRGSYCLRARTIPVLALALLLALLASPALTPVQASSVDDGHCVVGSTSGSTTWYFAEGCVRQGFNTYLCLGNPNAQEASTYATYILGNGQTVEKDYLVPASSRFTVDLVSELGFRGDSSGDVSIKLTSNRPIMAERPMYFEGTYAGGHDAVGATALEKDWYFAEGYTGGGFDEYVCVLNTNNAPADLTFRFQTQEAGEVSRPGSVPAHSRATFKVNDLLGANYQSSLHLESNQPVVAERPMYFDYLGTKEYHWQGGHCVMGLTQLAKSYYFAEGTTRSGFEEWLTLQNPGDSPITIKATYQLGTGQGAPVTNSYIVGANRRSTIFVNGEVGQEKDVSVRLASSSEFLAERPMYFRYTGWGANWTGGHCVIGATDTGTDWFFAEGYTGGGFHEWLTIQNPGSKDTQVSITYLPKGQAAFTRNHQVAANSRYTVFVNNDAGVNLEISCKVHSSEPVVVERPIYFDYAMQVPTSVTLTAKFLDVGEADSCILKVSNSSQNFFALVDTGGIKGTSGKVVSELQGMGCSELNVLVLAHPDADHVGGATAVMDSFKVHEVWDPGIDGSNSATWQEVKATIAARGIPRRQPHAGETYSWGGVQTRVLNPPAGVSYSETNDYSIVLIETIGSEDMMLTGDAQTSAQSFMASASFPDIEVFKVPHHGANSGYYAPFFNKVHPPNSVISVGPNSYGHPSISVINALGAFGTVYRTDNNGDVTATATANTLQITASGSTPSPSPSPSPTPTTGPFVGSVNSDVYHYPSCTYAGRIKPENLITFTNAQDAVNQGYRPCNVCNPPLP